MYRYCFYDLKVHFWWPNKRLFSYIQRWKTLYKVICKFLVIPIGCNLVFLVHLKRILQEFSWTAILHYQIGVTKHVKVTFATFNRFADPIKPGSLAYYGPVFPEPPSSLSKQNIKKAFLEGLLFRERHGNGPKHNLSECMWRSDVADFYPHFFYFRSILIHMSYAGGMGRNGMINDGI